VEIEAKFTGLQHAIGRIHEMGSNKKQCSLVKFISQGGEARRLIRGHPPDRILQFTKVNGVSRSSF
jgi:hypothetical protein